MAKEMESQEFDYLFYKAGSNYWKRDFAVLLNSDLRERVVELQKAHPFCPVMIVHHLPYHPRAATAYSDSGLELYIAELRRIKTLQETPS